MKLNVLKFGGSTHAYVRYRGTIVRESSGSLRIILMGLGNIGKELIRRISGDPKFRLVALADTSGTIQKESSFSERELDTILMIKDSGGKLQDYPGEHEYYRKVQNVLDEQCADVLVDATATQTYDTLKRSLEFVHVVASNKMPFADVSYDDYQKLLTKARDNGRLIEYGTTAGAGLKVPDLIRDLGICGVQSFSGCLSGTMNYISQRVNEGIKISTAIKEAMSPPRNYTEPDPRDDLEGADFARKIVIVGRLCGNPVELDYIDIEKLVKDEHRGISLEDFVDAITEYNTEMHLRIDEARKEGNTIWYLGRAEIENEEYQIGFKKVPLGDSITLSRESDNVFTIYPNSWRRPVTIIGPGASPPETVTGLIAGLSTISLWINHKKE